MSTPATALLEVLAYAADGTRRPRAVRLPAAPFDGRVHQAALHRAVTVFLANQRQGTAQTKIRKFVTGGNQKPWRQKGTGRARQGSIRSPLWPGGGTIFGPLPREYRLRIPGKIRRLARSSAFNARAMEHAIRIIEPLVFEAPKTRRVAELLGRMGLGARRVLFLTKELNPNLILSTRNIPDVSVMRFGDVSAYDLLHAEAVVIEEAALGAGALEPGGDAAAIAPPEPAPKAKARPAAEPKPKPAAAKGKRAAASAAKKPAAKTPRAEKPAAKKPAAPKAKKEPEARKADSEPKKGKGAKKPGKKE